MNTTKTGKNLVYSIVLFFLWSCAVTEAFAHGGGSDAEDENKVPPLKKCRVITADRLFDGNELHEDWGVLIKKSQVAQTGPANVIKKLCIRKMHLGNATILLGFIESHAHITYQHVKKIEY